MLYTTGGAVGGDRLSWQFHLQPGVCVLFATMAMGKIYRTNALEAKQTIQSQVDARFLRTGAGEMGGRD